MIEAILKTIALPLHKVFIFFVEMRLICHFIYMCIVFCFLFVSRFLVTVVEDALFMITKISLSNFAHVTTLSDFRFSDLLEVNGVFPNCCVSWCCFGDILSERSVRIREKLDSNEGYIIWNSGGRCR